MEDYIFDTEDSVKDSNFKRGDVVKMYKEGTELSYPCIMLECDKLEMFRIEAMKGMLAAKTLLDDDDTYAIYIHMQNQVVGVGAIPKTKLKVLLSDKVFDIFTKKAHLDKETTIEGNMLYALCMSTDK